MCRAPTLLAVALTALAGCAGPSATLRTQWSDQGGVALSNPATQWDNPFAAIDNHALATPPERERTIADLATWLTAPARNDTEKVRAIYRWMTDRIRYNIEDLVAGRDLGDQSAQAVLQTRKAVCAGYADLFVALVRQTGVPVVTIHGNAKGLGYVYGEPVQDNHAWNAVQLDGQWRLIDATWGAGSADPGRGYVKRFLPFYFLADPAQFIFSHLPSDPRWQLLPPVSAQTYARWPKVNESLFAMGFSAATARALVEQPQFAGFVFAWYVPNAQIRLLDAPLAAKVPAGEPLTVALASPELEDVAFIVGNQFQHLTRDGAVFRGTVQPQPGRIKLSGRIRGDGNRYWGIVEYVVE